MRRSVVCTAAAALALATAGTGSAAAATSASASQGAPSARPWAPAATAAIHPGMPTDTLGAGCTANFVYTDRSGAVYLGQAAHCSGKDAGALSTSGCEAGSQPLGTAVTFGESGVTGTLAYSSWLTMQAVKETDEATCLNNDFALVKIPAAAVGSVNPSLPVFGGPVAVATDPLFPGDALFGYGNSNLRGGAEVLLPQRGIAVTTDESGWYHLAYILSPGVPGDSGGGILDPAGRAVGVLVSLNTTPPGSNGLVDVGRALAYAQKHSGIKGLKLEPGTEPFTG